MKVLLLVHSLDVGGTELMVAHLARHLRASGDEVEVGCLGALGAIGEDLRAEGIPVLVHARGPGFDATLPLRLAQRVRAGRFDIVHAHQRTALFYGLLGGLLHKAPIAYTEHGFAFDDATLARLRWFNRLLGRRVRLITAVSADLARQLTTHEGFAGRAIVVVPNGIDCELWASADHAGRDAARALCGLPPEAVVMGSVARLHPVKRHHVLVEVVAHLRRSIPELTLVLVGDGPERAALMALARDLGVADAVHLLGVRRDVQHILPAFDVFCLTSWREGIPLTLLEAMAARVPVVATTAGGIPEAVRAEVDGLLITPVGAEPPSLEAGTPPHLGTGDASAGRDVERFAAAVKRVLSDAALRQRLTQQAFLRVRADFALADVCRRYRELLGAVR